MNEPALAHKAFFLTDSWRILMTGPMKPLPNVCLITPEPDTQRFSQYLKELEGALVAGIRLVQFRAKHLEHSRYVKLASEVSDCCSTYQAILLLNAAPSMLDFVDADGIHLDGHQLSKYKKHQINKNKYISVACHSIDQLEKAHAIEASFVTLSPVLETASHPGVKPLGWEKFSNLAKHASVPVFALGGMNPKLLKKAQDNGAYGVAGIRAFWSK